MTYVAREPISITSLIGINSDSVISGSNWSGNTYTGVGELNNYAYIGANIQVDESGILYFDFSQDGTNWSTFPVAGFTVASGINEVHTAWKGGRYFRARFVGIGGRTYFRLKTFYTNAALPLSSPLNQSIGSDQDASVTRAVLTGETDGGKYINVPVDGNGHLEVAIHGPLLPFGSMHTEKLTPVFQTDAVYGINLGQVKVISSLSGTATTDDAKFQVTTGTTSLSQGVIQSRRRLRYRPGQGIVSLFTAKFTSPVDNSYQLVGCGHAEDGLYVGYRNIVAIDGAGVNPFGILYVNRGIREIQTLTITTASSTTESITITLSGVVFSVPVTNSGNIQRTVWEISQFVYSGWTCFAKGSTVVFLANDAANKAGAFTLVGTTAVGTFAETRAGASVTGTANEQFIPQSSWNGDKLDGTGNSGFTLDPTKGNLFRVGIQFLGFGAITFEVEVAKEGNNSTWVVFHTILNPNSRITTTFANPSFPFTMAAYSAGSTTDVSVSVGSYAGFIEGSKTLHGNRFSYFNSLTTVGATNFQALFTIMNSLVYGGKPNQSVINLLSVTGALKHTSPCIFYLIKGGALAGNPSFAATATYSAAVYDTAATTVTYTTNDQLIWTGHLGDTGEIDHHFGNGSFNAEEVTLQPGEWVTLAAKAVTGTPSYVTGSINTREDQ